MIQRTGQGRAGSLGHTHGLTWQHGNEGTMGAGSRALASGTQQGRAHHPSSARGLRESLFGYSGYVKAEIWHSGAVAGRHRQTGRRGSVVVRQTPTTLKAHVSFLFLSLA